MTYYFTGNFVQLISGIEVSNTIVFLDSSVLPICFKLAIFHIKLSNLPNSAWSRFVNRRKRQFSSFTLIVSSIKLPKALRYCYLQDQKWCLSVHLAWFKPLSPAVIDKRIPRSTSNLLSQLWTVEEVRILYSPKIFTPEEGKESIFFFFATVSRPFWKWLSPIKKPLDQIFKNLLGKRTFVPPKPGGMSATFSVSFLFASWSGCSSLLTGMKTKEDWLV